MNAELQLLEQQCWEASQWAGGPEWFNHEKFAELVMLECFNQIEAQRFEVPEGMVEGVKQHFGFGVCNEQTHNGIDYEQCRKSPSICHCCPRCGWTEA